MSAKIFSLFTILLFAIDNSSQLPAAIINSDIDYDLLAERAFEDELKSSGLTIEIYREALAGHKKLADQIQKKNIISIIDFYLSSKEERMWVLDIEENKILFQTLVAHGENSGLEYANLFSNRPRSHQSSLGFFLTAETYQGKHGYSVRLDGMEADINDKARDRAIVIHGADYVSEEFIEAHGRLGRSHGCPAIPMNNYEAIIKVIANSSLLYIHHPNESYHQTSKLLNKPGQ